MTHDNAAHDNVQCTTALLTEGTAADSENRAGRSRLVL